MKTETERSTVTGPTTKNVRLSETATSVAAAASRAVKSRAAHGTRRSSSKAMNITGASTTRSAIPR
jgi:hypothetical protein